MNPSPLFIFDLKYNLNSIENSILKRKILRDLNECHVSIEPEEQQCELNNIACKKKKEIKEIKEINPYKKEELEVLMNSLIEQYRLDYLHLKEEYKESIWSSEIPILKDKYEIGNFTFNVLNEIHLRQKIPSWITSVHGDKKSKPCKLVSIYHLIMKIIPTISLENRFRLRQSHVMKITQFLNKSNFVTELNSTIRVVLVERFKQMKALCMFLPLIPKKNKKLLMKGEMIGIKKKTKMIKKKF